MLARTDTTHVNSRNERNNTMLIFSVLSESAQGQLELKPSYLVSGVTVPMFRCPRPSLSPERLLLPRCPAHDEKWLRGTDEVGWLAGRRCGLSFCPPHRR